LRLFDQSIVNDFVVADSGQAAFEPPPSEAVIHPSKSAMSIPTSNADVQKLLARSPWRSLAPLGIEEHLKFRSKMVKVCNDFINVGRQRELVHSTVSELMLMVGQFEKLYDFA
jgi:hypothetical protein